jgi:hypothetical protein
MSVTPTDEELIVALDFEGQTNLFWSLILTDDSIKSQVWIASRGRLKKIRFLFYSTRQFPISCVGHILRTSLF